MNRVTNGEVMPDQGAILVFHVRRSRQKAMQAAMAEAVSLLADFEPAVLAGGPLGDHPGLFWVKLPASVLPAALERIPLLGYTSAVDAVRFSESGGKRRARRRAIQPTWRGRPFDLHPLYHEDSDRFRDQAPDRRSFVLRTKEGSLVRTRGYRGDGGELGRRGLPVTDARLLANLAFTRIGGRMLDPFADAGGVVLAGLQLQQEVFSLDIDPALQWGLHDLGARHFVGDARHLPFEDATFDSVASEAPFQATGELLGEVMMEIARVLRPCGRVAAMLAEHQAAPAREGAREGGLLLNLDTSIDRKGLPVVVLAWKRAPRTVA